jgi:hypothetical protein
MLIEVLQLIAILAIIPGGTLLAIGIQTLQNKWRER